MLRIFGRVAIVVVALAFAFGLVHGWHAAPGTVSRNQARWHADEPAHYSFVFTRGSMAGTCVLAVSVSHARVTATHVLRQCGGQLDPAPAPTIDDVFSQVRAAYRDGDKVVVTYDARRGFPKRVSVDPEPRAVDDEWSLGVSEFRAS